MAENNGVDNHIEIVNPNDTGIDNDMGIDLYLMLQDYTRDHNIDIFEKCNIISFMKFYYKHSVYLPGIEERLVQNELNELNKLSELSELSELNESKEMQEDQNQEEEWTKV
jgi:hypothetical protein